MSRCWQLYRSSVGKKSVMAITGLLLGSFLLVHALGNSSIFWGRQAFIGYATHLHKLGVLIQVAEILLLSIFLVHVYTGFLLFLQNRQARGDHYALHHSAGGRSWGSRTMIYTGGIILLFVVMHLLNFHFISHDRTVADVVRPILTRPWYTILYLIGLGALALHISHGFWSLLQSLGISHPRYDRLLRNLSRLFMAMISLIFVTIVLLLAFNRGYLT